LKTNILIVVSSILFLLLSTGSVTAKGSKSSDDDSSSSNSGGRQSNVFIFVQKFFCDSTDAKAEKQLWAEQGHDVTGLDIFNLAAGGVYLTGNMLSPFEKSAAISMVVPQTPCEKGELGICEACNSASDCPAGESCHSSGLCFKPHANCNSNADCPAGQVCSTTANICFNQVGLVGLRGSGSNLPRPYDNSVGFNTDFYVYIEFAVTTLLGLQTAPTAQDIEDLKNAYQLGCTNDALLEVSIYDFDGEFLQSGCYDGVNGQTCITVECTGCPSI